MKGKNTLTDKPFRYGGILKDYSKEIHELNGHEYKCWCCGKDMKSHVPGTKVMPYTATFRITKGKNKGLVAFRPLCRSCAYRYGRGVVECDGNTYMEPDEFSEKKWKKGAVNGKNQQRISMAYGRYPSRQRSCKKRRS